MVGPDLVGKREGFLQIPHSDDPSLLARQGPEVAVHARPCMEVVGIGADALGDGQHDHGGPKRQHEVMELPQTFYEL
eukprot:CAMPEP_0177630562 /NCGR_PEP_ID=MMETSP0447-20121125/1274_1 /TAXON_ID=0 /ORGANISM="Stygamoeba regulata, Strain BSH-02190019" /LENGTH=76 /DNA_ID=CAMNT_0019131971 /DNA_START=668 /DNA_END=898 /DNA_ORIENTATION=+